MLNNPFDGREIWFYTGTQDLYGDETLAEVEQQSKAIVQQLNESTDIALPIVWKPLLKDRDGIRAAMLEANYADSCVGVITWMHTFSPAKMWISGLSSLDKPLLHLHTQANVSLPWESIDMDFMNLNQAAHGDREFGYICTRLGVNRAVVVGHVSSLNVRTQIDSWARVATGRQELRTMKLARFGDNMRNVAVTEGDKTEAELQFGPAVNTWSVNDLAEAVENADPDAVASILCSYDEDYEVVPELRKGGAQRESLEYAAKLEVGMRHFLEAGGFSGFTTNFEDLGELRQLPGLAVQRLMADGYGFGAEGDWKTAILVRLAKVIGFGRPGGASLMEDYTYEFGEGREKILGAHMLEVCPSLTKKMPSLEIHPLGIGDREDPVRLKFDADPGEALVVALTDMRDRFRITANQVTIVGPDAPMPNLPVASAVWTPKPDLATSAACWIYAGAAHHTCMTTNTTPEEWALFAQMTGNELVMIDDTTTKNDFLHQLEWNNAFFRLARGV